MLKEATTIYLTGNTKRDGKSVEQVFNIIKGKWGTSVIKITLQKYVKSGIVG